MHAVGTKVKRKEVVVVVGCMSWFEHDSRWGRASKQALYACTLTLNRA